MNLNIMKEETLQSVLSKTQEIAAYTEIIAQGGGMQTWAAIQSLVKGGLAKSKFPVGYEFTTTDSDTNEEVIWVVRDHDHHKKVGDENAHTMTLETKYVYSNSGGSQRTLQFDAVEAFYYAESGLAAGTYNITISNQNWYSADNGKTFQFTLSKAVPAGGQLVFNSSYNQTLEGKTVQSFASNATTTVLESATITEGSSGTSLGTTDGNSTNVNFFHRTVLGSNNYYQSAARQWLNSAEAAGSVWKATNKYDRPASWASSYAGFMHSLPSDFLAVVQPAIVECRTNSVFEIAGLDGTAFTTNQTYNIEADKFFLLSRPEIFGDWDSTAIKDGTVLDYYDGLTATERIRYDAGGTARHAWLRSPDPGSAGGERGVNTSGAVNYGYAYISYGVAPACIIA